MFTNKWQDDVKDFHEKFAQKVRDRPTSLPREEIDLRRALIFEEALETAKALEDGDLEGIADGCADLIYVTLGLCVTTGIDLEPVWNEVHRANMSKVAGGKREDGKVLKPKGWKPPDVKRIISEQLRKAEEQQANLGPDEHDDSSSPEPTKS